MTEAGKINKHPNVIGYWARVHDFSLYDCLTHPVLSDHLALPHQQEEFRAGWEEAEGELRNESFQALLGDLCEAYDELYDSKETKVP